MEQACLMGLKTRTVGDRKIIRMDKKSGTFMKKILIQEIERKIWFNDDCFPDINEEVDAIAAYIMQYTVD